MTNTMNGPLARITGLALAAASISLAALGSNATPFARADDDDEEKEIRRVEARRSFAENCLMCHGEDMTSRQRLTTKQWTAEVEKMVGWGAPLPLERKQPLVDYLAETYSPQQAAPPRDRITIDRALALEPQPAARPIPGADPAKGQTLFATHCAACHGPLAKGGDLGINLVEKPPLLREDEFRALLKDGRRRMPSFATVIDGPQQADLLAWLRGQK